MVFGGGGGTAGRLTLDATGTNAGTGLTTFNIAGLDGTSRYLIELELLSTGSSSGGVDMEPNGTSGGDMTGVKLSTAGASSVDQQSTTASLCAITVLGGAGLSLFLELDLNLTKKRGWSRYLQTPGGTNPLAGFCAMQWSTSGITNIDIARTGATVTFDTPSWSIYRYTY